MAFSSSLFASPKTPTVWIFTDHGKVGTERQCKGLVEALGFSYETWSFLPPRFPLSWLPRRFWSLKTAHLEDGNLLDPPWPHLVVAAGRTSVICAAKIRTLSEGKTFVIVLQNPRMNLDRFNLVISPRHDCLVGDNVIQTLGALHDVTPEKIQQAALTWQKKTSLSLPQPWIAVLIGGPNRHCTLNHRVMEQLVSDLKKLHKETGAGFMVTCSRRTPEKERLFLKVALQDLPSVYFDGEGENPYLAYLGSADYIIVTSDSVSMLSEAASTDKPLYIYELPGKAKKFVRFHEALVSQGIARFFKGKLTFWARAPYSETRLVAEGIKKILPFQDL